MEVGRTQANTPAFHQPVVSPVLSYFRWPSAAKLDDPENDPSSNYFKTENSEDSLASTAYSLHHLRNGDFSSWSGVVGSGGGMYNKGNEGMHASLNPNHLWLIWFLSMIAFVFILFGCSLRNKYFQESFLLSRAKQWVHLPVLNSAQDPLLLVEPGNVSYTVADCCSNGTDWEPTGLNEQHADLTWVSETDKFPTKPEECSNIQVENERCNNQDDSILHPSLVPLGSTPQPQDHEDLMAMENEIISSDYLETPVCLSPLTKTGSLDETQIGSCRKELQEKRFKANRSVEEFHQPGSNSIGSDSLPATPAGKGVGGGSSSPGTPQGKSRAKLQERRGSSHSLTIAVKSTENILPPVTTPRECSATQFLLTAGNCMNRHQLRSCLRDVKSLHAEFWSIPTNAPDPVEQATGSALKNRYRYVLPNPHSRVKLPCDADESDTGSEYINGNYIRAYDGKPGIYIATQGPLANTINDFWIMVWNEKAPAVIMITKLVEGGRAKCESYLPEENDGNFARYGRISVHVDKIDEHEGYIVRRLTLKNDDYPDRIHSTSHYWYSDWPDHKTPDNPRTLVDMAIAVESLRRSAGNGSPGSASEAQDKEIDIGPIIVHCSAGVGRTGCFIALCQGLSQLTAEGRVDILGIVCALRCDRGGMVQTAEQYEFIHRGLCLFERTLAD